MRNSLGLTLVEVLVALALITILSTGFMVASIHALRSSQEVALRETALLLVRDAAERMLTHQLTWSQAQQTLDAARLSSGTHQNCYTHPCPRDELALVDWQQLTTRLEQQLPDARLHLSAPCTPGSAVGCLWVTWRGAPTQACFDSGVPISLVERSPGCLGVTLWLPGVSDALR